MKMVAERDQSGLATSLRDPAACRCGCASWSTTSTRAAATRCWLAWRRAPSARFVCSTHCRCRSGTPAKCVLLSLHEFERVNRRMHNKLFIVDARLPVASGLMIGAGK